LSLINIFDVGLCPWEKITRGLGYMSSLSALAHREKCFNI